MGELSGVTALVLCGGLGTRLEPVLQGLPKALAPLLGRPFLAWLLDRLAGTGLEKAVLCSGHLGERIEQHFGRAYLDLALEYSREERPLGTGGALRLALPAIASPELLVLNGDSLCTAELRGFVAWARAAGAEAALLLAHVLDAGRFGRVETDPAGRVLRFAEKHPAPGPGWINAGVYYMRREVAARIPEGPSSLERDFLPALVGAGLLGLAAPGEFIDIGTPASLEQAPRIAAWGEPPAEAGP